MKNHKILFSTIIFVSLLVMGHFAMAQLGVEYGAATGLGGGDIRLTIANIIRIILGFIGVILIGLLIYAGFIWMTSAGNEEKISQAKKIIINAVIGLAIVLSAFAVTSFVVLRLSEATGLGGGIGVPPGGGGLGGNAYVLRGISPTGAVSIRNVVVKAVLSGDVDPASVPGNFTVKKKIDGSVIAGALTQSGSTILFTPSANCPPPNESIKCFDENTDYQVELLTGIKSASGQSLVCGGFAPLCLAEFRTGNLVDTSPPTISLTYPNASFPYVYANSSNVLQATATDDSGISYVQFLFNATVIDTLVPSSVVKIYNPTLDWDGAGLVAKSSVNLSAKTSDLDANERTSSELTVKVLAAHCNNAFKDADETGIDCGGADCLACSGSACTSGDQCATGACIAGSCVEQPIIFEVDKPDGAVGNLVAIRGNYFGANPGRVIFLGGAGTTDDREASLATCATAWSNTEIVVMVPAGATSGPLQVISVNNLADETNDARGPTLPDFLVNSIVRPGICSVSPKQGGSGDEVSIIGNQFGAGQGGSTVQFETRLATVVSGKWNNANIGVIVPTLTEGKYRLSVTRNGETSNAVLFTVSPKTSNLPAISYIDPITAAPTDYITVFGQRFGTTPGTITFKNVSLGDTALGNTDFPLACGTVFWHDTYIVVKVPENYQSGLVITRNAPLEVRVVRADGAQSGPATFTVNSAQPRPGICQISPDNGPVGTVVQVFGERFGANPGKLFFYNDLNSLVTYWNPDGREIGSVVPNGAVTGPVTLVSQSGEKSNGVNFEINDCRQNACGSGYQCCGASCIPVGEVCLAGPKQAGYVWRFSTGPLAKVPRVIEEQACAIGTQSPSPWKNTTNACLNAAISFRFNLLMNKLSINQSSVKVQACGNTAVFSDGLCGASLADYSTFTFTDSGTETSVNLSGPAFTRGLWYRVTIDETVQSIDGVNLSAPYTWHFKVQGTTMPANGLISYWTMDDNDVLGGRVLDKTRTNNLTNNGTVSAGGQIEQSRLFNGTTDFMSLASPLNLPISSVARTISLWIKPAENCANNGAGGSLIHWGDGTGGDQEFILQLTNISGACYLFTDGINSANNVTISGTQIPPVGVWSHLVFTLTSTNAWTYYLNGAERAAGVFSIPINTASSTILNIGERSDVVQPRFAGNIDEIRIYNRALLPQEIDAPVACALNTVLVMPGELTLIEPEGCLDTKNCQGKYTASPQALNCNVLKCADYPWTWSLAGNNGNARIISASCEAQVMALKETGSTPVKVVATTVSGAESKSGSGDLFIKFADPRVVSYWPNCTSACINAQIGAEFNIQIDVSTLNETNIKILECTEETCTAFATELGLTISYDPDTSNVRIYTSSLRPNTYYRVRFTPGILSANGARLIGLNENGQYFSWIFKTKSDETVCGVSRVEISPNFAQATLIGQSHIFTSVPYGSPDSCNTNGQPLNPLQYGWNWDSSNISVGKFERWTGFNFTKNLYDGTLFNFAPQISGQGCSAACLMTGTKLIWLCGNGKIDKGENCDDSNSFNGDGCSNKCLAEGSSSLCGNGKIDLGETCDDGNTKEGDGCSKLCLNEGSEKGGAICGNGDKGKGEDCDDKNNRGGDGCSALCLVEGTSNVGCGNKIVESWLGEACDDGNIIAGDGCSKLCLFEGSLSKVAIASICGDGIFGVGEDCDDGNVIDGDGCSSVCTFDPILLASTCGDGFIDPSLGENCDDGNNYDGDGCSATCVLEDPAFSAGTPFICGDRILIPSEQCDDGNIKNGDGCSSWCTFESVSGTTGAPSYCGDGVIGTGEVCDDSNKENGDGCSDQCLKEGSSYYYYGVYKPSLSSRDFGSACGNAVVEIGEECDLGVNFRDDKGFDPAQVVRAISGLGMENQSVISASNGSQSGQATYQVLCGASKDFECSGGFIAGVGRGSCCYARPYLKKIEPAYGASNVCRNAAIIVDFTESMAEVSFQNNLILLEERKDFPVSCPNRLERNGLVFCSGPKANFEFRTLTDSTSEVIARPVSPLLANTSYAIQINGDGNVNDGARGVLSQNGVGLSDTRVISVFKAGVDICKISKIEVNPNTYLFKKVDETAPFLARALSFGNANILTELTPMPIYSWTWKWSANPSLEKIASSADQSSVTVQALNKNGESSLVASATITDLTSATSTPAAKSGSAKLKNFLCLNPVFIDNTELGLSRSYNFSLAYCRDAGETITNDDLPKLGMNISSSLVSGMISARLSYNNVKASDTLYMALLGDPTILEDRILTLNCGGLNAEASGACQSGDAIGLRIVLNSGNLSPLEWWRSKGFSGNPTSLEVDGYEAIVEGRTVYIAAANQPSLSASSPVYNNIYILSHSQAAKTETIRIFNQLINNWRFNTNFPPQNLLCAGTTIECASDIDCAVGVRCDADLSKLRRNFRRVTDLVGINKLLQSYQTTKGAYPQMPEGSFVREITLSKWDSWQQALGASLGATLPKDPLNKFRDCGAQTGDPSTDKQTCWNSERKTFSCGVDSAFYTYSHYQNKAYLLAQLERGNVLSELYETPANVSLTPTLCPTSFSSQTPACGNGVIESGEECDSTPPTICGLNSSGAYEQKVCETNCKFKIQACLPPTNRCGNGIVESNLGEICDDGSENGSYGRCNTTCTAIGLFCGDNIKQPEEFCDLGSAQNGQYYTGTSASSANSCNNTCSVLGPYCGDKLLNGAETCDSNTIVSDRVCEKRDKSNVVNSSYKTCSTDSNCLADEECLPSASRSGVCQNVTNPTLSSGLACNTGITVPTSGLISYWTMDNVDISGSTVYDKIGINHLTNTNASSVSGKLLQARLFNGTTDFMSKSSPANLPSAKSARTIALWVNMSTSCATTGGGGNLFHYGDGAGGGQEFILEMANIGGTCYLFTDGVNGINNVTATVVPTTGVWTHIAFTMSEASAWSYYLNGVQQKTGILPIKINTASPNTLNIGRRSDTGSGGGTNFPGSIDDVRIYNRVLTAGEISALINPSDNCPSGESCVGANARARWSVACNPSCQWGNLSKVLIGQCGNGVTDPGEECDDKNTNDTDSCLTTCKLARCGDGKIQNNVEECDQGANNGTIPTTVGYGKTQNYCDLSCKIKTQSGGYCGDGQLNGPEECDNSVSDPVARFGGKSCLNYKLSDGRTTNKGSLSCKTVCTIDLAQCSTDLSLGAVAPEGFLDWADSNICSIGGWTRDRNTVNPINIAVEAKKSGAVVKNYTFLASAPRPDLNSVFGILDINHGYAQELTGIYDGTAYDIYVYGIDPVSGSRTALSAMPRTLTCSARSGGGGL